MIAEPSLYTQVNFVLNPKPYYADPLEIIFEDPAVERNHDRMFSLEAPMITRKSRSLKNLFPFRMNLIILRSVGMREKWIWPLLSMRFLRRCWIEWVTLWLIGGSLTYTQRVFLEQKREGIIEWFNVSPEQYGHYIWIPHRPVIKDGDLTTTKISSVFNCSLKVRNASSLNEAVYPGINLLSDFLDLL